MGQDESLLVLNFQYFLLQSCLKIHITRAVGMCGRALAPREAVTVPCLPHGRAGAAPEPPLLPVEMVGQNWP